MVMVLASPSRELPLVRITALFEDTNEPPLIVIEDPVNVLVAIAPSTAVILQLSNVMFSSLSPCLKKSPLYLVETMLPFVKLTVSPSSATKKTSSSAVTVLPSRSKVTLLSIETLTVVTSLTSLIVAPSAAAAMAAFNVEYSFPSMVATVGLEELSVKGTTAFLLMARPVHLSMETVFPSASLTVNVIVFPVRSTG